MKRKHRKNMGLALQLIRRSLSVLIPFELVYKIAAVYIIVPFCAWLVSTTLTVAGVDYISSENMWQGLLNPMVLLSVFVVLVLFTGYTIFEISFLTLTFNQSYQQKPLGFFRMLSVSAQDAARVIRPRNYALILFVVVIIPISNSVMVSSLLGGLEIPNYMMEIIVETPLYLWGIILLMLVLLGVLIRYVFVLHVYTLEDKSVPSAMKEASALAKGRRIRILWSFLLWQTLCGLAIGLVSALITVSLSLIAAALADNESLYAVMLTVNMTVQKVLAFITPSLMVFAGYSMISAMFFHFREESEKDLPPAMDTHDQDSPKENRRICVISCLICLVSVVGMSYISAHQSDLGSAEDMLIMAHRGSSVGVPENTLPAFQKAIDLGADYIELDVQESKDGQIVVTHDANFVRCTGVNANVWALTLPEIKTLNAGKRFGKEYEGTKIPTLEEVIALCKGKIRLNIELKSNGHEKNLEGKVAEILTEYEFDDQVVITSLTKKCLVKFRELKPDIPCGYIVSMAAGNYLDVPWSDFFSVEQSFISKELIHEAHKRGKTINGWTIDDEDSVSRMIRMGADSVITGDPLMAREAVLAYQDPLHRLIYAISQ